jgi:hypothetical protein
LTSKVDSDLLNLLDHIIDYDFTYIPWYSLLTWVNEQENKDMNQNKNNNLINENFETFTIDKKI